MNPLLRYAIIGLAIALEAFCLLDLLAGFLLAPLSFFYKIEVFLPSMLLIALCLASLAALLLHPGGLKRDRLKRLSRSLPLVIWYVAAGSMLRLAALQALSYMT